ncbi:MAG: TonB-dependent receptor [Bacteroidales bacterium]|nr:TonB-dependent receptor [Bacteroidales bacterium]
MLLCVAWQGWAAAPLKLSGKVVESGSGDPVAGAIVRLDENYLWAVTDTDGTFLLAGAERGTYILEVDCLGYVTYTREISVKKDLTGLVVTLSENSLALQEVVVTAETSKDNLNTTRKIGRQALDHLQMNSMSGIGALLPGGKTLNPDLTQDNALALRSGGSSVGNAAFSTAVEVNGVRMGDNASFGGMEGIGTRSLSVENIESVEVLTGVPSAEYGDFGSGMIRVTTKKGRTPLNIVLSVNPRTYEVSVSKGLDIGKGTLNVGAEWANATSKLTSPYTSYTRRGFTLDYTRTFAKVLRLEAGLNGNIGGMDSKNDPDALAETHSKVNDNLLTPHFKLTWLLNKSWITNLTLEGSVYFHDTRSLDHVYNSNASVLPAVHATQQGYWMADALPTTYYADQVKDSKELDYAASLKYHWLHHWGGVKNVFKAGVQWKADGNVGQGEYYLDPALAENGYRPRPYTIYPYMHTLAGFAEENVTIPIGRTSLSIMAGLRLENVFIKGSRYDKLNILSPRFNLKWELSDHVALRGGWGVAGKLPSFYILYPRQEYLDIRSTSFSHGDSASYVFYTQPFQMEYNPNLRWQRNQNAEVGVDIDWKGFKLSLAGFYNLTKDPYEFGTVYTPISYSIYQIPEGITVPDNPHVVLDHHNGSLYLQDADGYYVPAQFVVTDRSFAASRRQENGADIHRYGIELVADFPEIKPLHTTLRLDASWNHTEYTSTVSSYLYSNGWSHSQGLASRKYEYVGVYTGSSSSVANGRITDNIDANLTAITHIPEARLVISVRLEAALLRNARNTSYRAFTVGEKGYDPTGGDIYGDPSYTAAYPSAYMDLDGNIHEWTAESAANPALQRLILRSGNMYVFAQDGYSPYLSANVSVTKEIGKHVSISFFANNFTNARPYVSSWATGVSAIFTPNFYYGLRCTIKI